jgi:hypothetical protein
MKSSATFTFRIPDSMAGRLSSAGMRAWLTQFRRSPYPLPQDPGSGSERISLTLPRELVRDVAGYVHCSASIALRRVAAAHLNVQGAPKMSAPYRPSGRSPIAAPKPTTSHLHMSLNGYQIGTEQDNFAVNATAQEISASLWVPILIGGLIVGALMFFGTGEIGAPELAWQQGLQNRVLFDAANWRSFHAPHSSSFCLQSWREIDDRTPMTIAMQSRSLRYNELKKDALEIFARHGGWLTPKEWAVRISFYPMRASYSYLLRLHRFGLLHRNSTGRTVAYHLSVRGRRRLDWLKQVLETWKLDLDSGVFNVNVVRPNFMPFLPCLLCGNKLERRSDKHAKPYFVCDSCGIQLFVRKKQGIERLDTLLQAAETNAALFKEAAHRVFEVEALLSEIDGTKAQIKKVEGEIGFLFPDEEKIRARDALKIRLNNLVNQFEDFCKEET